MSKGNIARRIALLSTSSLGLAAVASAASLGMALTPTRALAANECGVQSGSTPIVCNDATYFPGVTYDANGNLVINFTATTTEAGVDGINLIGSGSESITFDSATSAAELESRDTVGPLLDVTTVNGSINIQTEEMDADGQNPAGVTHAIRATSGSGDINITSTGTIDVDSSANPVGAIAIEAASGGGDVTVDHTVSNSSSINGRLYGIYAQTSGAGDVDITVQRLNSSQVVSSTSTQAGGAAIYAQTGTGAVTIDGRGTGGAGTGVLINSGGDINFTGSASGLYGVDIVNVASGRTATINLTAATTGTAAVVRAAGSGDVDVNISGLQAAMNFDFTGMSAPVDVDIVAGGAWRPTPNVETVIADGNFVINIEEGAALVAGVHTSGSGPTVTNALEPATVLTFADPNMVLSNAGYIIVGPDQSDTSHQFARHEAELRLVNLNEFRNSGTILLGGAGYPGKFEGSVQSFKTADTDSWYDDILTFENGRWIGEEGTVAFDVDTNRTQTNCIREAVTNDFQAADCLRIVNSTVEGVTYVRVNQTFAGDRGRLTQQIMDDGIVLVETPGSAVAANNFALDPTMKNYNPDAASLDKGLYQYVLLFDQDAEQFKLFGTLSGAAYQLPIGSTAAHNLWRLSTGSWLERQADLRGQFDQGMGGGIWLRALGEQTNRDIIAVSTLGGLPFSVDNSYQADTYALNGGVDLLSASTDTTAYVVGFMAGYGHSEVAYGASSNTQAMDAWSGGVYGSFIAGGLFIDAVVNANNVIIDTDNPGFDLLPEGTILSSRIFSVGGQVEAGWRFPFGDGLFAEPLAAVSYVRSKMEDLDIMPDDFSRLGLKVSFEDPSSFRAGVGGRLGMDSEYAGLRTQISVLGRVWNDLEGQNTASIHNVAFPNDPEVRVMDDFSGVFSEFAVGTGLYSLDGTVSGFFNFGGKFGDDYEAITGSAGVRINW